MRGGVSIFLILLLSAPLLAQSPAQCFPGAAPTYLRLSVDDTGSQAVLNAYLYSLNTTSAQRQATPVSGGLLFVSWADYPAGACRMATGSDGTANATFSGRGSNYPGGGQSLTYTVTFCPFTAYNADLFKPNPQWMANCARFRDAGGHAITRLDYATVPACPGAAANPVSQISVGAEQHDLSDSYSPSTSFLTLRNNAPSPGSVAFCWGLAAVFGLLFSAMFVSGRNPLYFLDFAATRGLRINRYSGYYMPMTQNVSVAPVAILSAADRMGNMTATALGSSEESDSRGDLTSAQNDVKDASATNEKVQADPKATPEQKTNARENLDKANGKLNNARTKWDAAKNLNTARAELKNAKTSDEKAKAQDKLDKAQKAYDKASSEFGDSAYSFNKNMQRASNQGLVSGWLGQQTGALLGNFDVFQSGAEKKDRSVWSNLGNTVMEGMVKTVLLSVPGMVMGRGKFGTRKALTALGESSKRQARVMAKEMVIDLVQAGANAVGPLLVHGISTPDSKEWKDAEKEVEDAKKNLDEKWANAHPYFKPEFLYAGPVDSQKADAEYAVAEKRYDAAQAKFAEVSGPLSQWNQAFSGGQFGQGLVRDLLSPTFDMLANQWFGAEQPPRLSAMNGLGGVFSLTLADYLAQPLKYAQGFDPLLMQRILDQQRTTIGRNQ